MVPVLEAIRPYLLLKAEQADILLALQETKMQATEGRGNGLSTEAISLREAGYRQLKMLNRRGR
jgi:hypothetical protein